MQRHPAHLCPYPHIPRPRLEASMQAPALPKPPATAPRLYLALTIALIGLALVPTVWPGLDLAAAQWFAPPDGQVQTKDWWWVQAINLYVPALFRGLIVVAIGAWMLASWRARWKQWRLPLAFFILSGALGPGLLVNAGFKDNWQRARPYQVQDFGGPQQFSFRECFY